MSDSVWPAVILHAREVRGFTAVLVQNCDSREDAERVAAALLDEARRALIEEVAAWLESDEVQDMIPSRKAQALRRRFGGPKP